ncbi:response regulator transcription factor [Agaribacterium haliotis]|uniref:response regulator transcription factor n=1 Tax=Agaribacterium haliotis TaxID=2013869 RepID=UPI000BB58A67|nr:response regulator transcription factor [Agaribacterium haliotis]
MANLKILIAEDNLAICKNIEAFMQKRSVELDFAHDGRLACELALNEYFDCIVLDIAMPKMDGLVVCRQLRQQSQRHIPILMLTARDSLDDKLTGFACGADDYLCKPFALEELYARCQALAARQQQVAAKVLSLGQGETQISLDLSARTASRMGSTVALQRIPFEILKLLMQAHPRTVTRSELCERIWHGEPSGSDSLRSHMYQLRQAIDKPFERAVIKTLHGVGFRIDI